MIARMKPVASFRHSACCLALAGLLLAACGVEPKRQAAGSPQAPAAPQGAVTAPAATPVPATTALLGPAAPAAASAAVGQNERPPKIAEIYPARGPAIDPKGGSRPQRPRRGDIKLDFVDADVREVAQVVLRDLLNVSFVIDPDVRGAVTVQTAEPISRADLLPTLEAVLAANGASVARQGGVFRVTRNPAALAAGGGLRVAQGAEGFSIAVYPLSFLGAAEIADIVTPLLPDGRVVRADQARGLLTVAASAAEHRMVRDAIDIFDVNQLAGHAVLLESLEHSDADTMAFELDNVFGGLQNGPLAGILRIIPIERMNAVLAISKQPEYLDETRQWIARLDRTQDGAGRRLFVYYAQNGKAGDLAKTLQGIFQNEAGKPVRLAGVEATGAGTAAGTGSGASGDNAAGAAAALRAGGGDEIRIMADEAANAVLILSTRAEYASVEDVLRRLDIQPLQVLIEAQIIEITLRDQLRLGVQYFLKSGGLSLMDGGNTIFSTGASTALSTNLPGFAFTLADAGQTRFVLDTLSELTDVNMVSSPQVLVLNNQTARLQAGDQVPIVTQVSSSTFTADNRIVNAVEYRDTGVTLDVTPRVNASGLVTLEIVQEVSDVTTTTTSTIDSPTIQQRKILSTVAVRSGASVALGGLIRESVQNTKSGLPGLSDLPVVGNLFGASANDSRRTELLVLITPTVLRNDQDARIATDSLRARYRRLLALQESGMPRRRSFLWGKTKL